jgi:iron complex outermembrane recepter protein
MRNPSRTLATVVAGILSASSLHVAHAADASVDAAASADGEITEVVVFGRGETRQVTQVSMAELAQVAPGTSPIKAIEKLPGVNFQSADPYGAYEWSTRITIRGFNQNQLGFTLDGLPLGDMSYANHNGLHISRAISTENVETITLSQGTGALGTASTNNLGGTLQFRSVDPAQQMGAKLAVTGGSESTRRVFARLESGEVFGGLRAYLSFADQQADKWKGDGAQEQQQVNFKAVLPVGEDGKVTAFYSWSDRAEQDYQDLSLEMIGRLGYDWDNISGDYVLAQQLATLYQTGGTLPAPFATIDDAYYDASGLRKDRLASLALDLPLGESLSLTAQAYLHKNRGQGTWFTPYVPTPAPAGGSSISVRTTEYDIDRKGGTAGLTWRMGDHELNGGVWFEDNDFNQARRFDGLQAGADPGRTATEFLSGPFFTQWQYAFNTKTSQFHLQDTWQVGEAVKLNFGFKSVKVENEANPVIATGGAVSVPSDIEAKEGFLPQLGANWAYSDTQEVFFSASKNMRAFIAAATGAAPFAATQVGFDAIRGSLQPETSTSLELGWRFRGEGYEGVVSAYHTKFEDRLLGISTGPGIVGAPVALQNVGSVKTQGIETGLNWKPAEHFSLYGSLSFNQSKYSDDVVDGNGVRTALKGKTVVDAPEFLAKLEGGYDNGSFFARVGVSHTGERYYSYLNDASVPATTLVDGSVGYRFGDLGFLKGLTLQANVTNLLDEEYVSTIGSNGFGNSDATGVAQTLLAGAPRQFFVTLEAKF